MSKNSEPAPDISAEQHLQAGAKAAKKSLFKSPDWVEAQSEYIDAGKLFSQIGNHAKATAAYEEASKCSIQLQQELPAAVNLRDAAKCCARGLQQGYPLCTAERVSQLHEQAALHFQRCGKFLDAARQCLNQGLLATNRLDKARLIQQATELFEQEGKPFQAASAMSELIDELFDQRNYKDVTIFIDKARQMYSKMTGYGHKIDYLAICQLIACLAVGDVVGAEQQLDQFQDFNGDAYQMGEELVAAFKNRDSEALEVAKKNFGGKLALNNAQLFVLRELKLDAEEEGL